MAELHVLAGNPAFLDLPWDTPLASWELDRIVDLPKGIHRHEVRFVAYDEGIYAVKELPRRLAEHEFETLGGLRELGAPAVQAAALVVRPDVDPHEEWSTAVITEYLDYAFSFREVVPTPSFTARRDKLLDGFANLLVELHLLGCFWGDCSLSNVLYRWDADAIEVSLVDAETARLYPELSDGQRLEDIYIMETNVAWGIGDIAASEDREPMDEELELGGDIAARYEALWSELHRDVVIEPHEQYRVQESIERVNALGYEVERIDLVPDGSGRSRVRMRCAVGGRRYHRRRLFELTRLEASEKQAKQILDDLRYFAAKRGPRAGGQELAAMEWRVHVFEPLIERIAAADPLADPVQAYVDFLHHRYLMSAAAQRDLPTEQAFDRWMRAGRPGREASD